MNGKIVWRKGRGRRATGKNSTRNSNQHHIACGPMCEIKESADEADTPRKLSRSNTSVSLWATFAYSARQHVGLRISRPSLWQLTKEATCCPASYIKVDQKLIGVCAFPCFRCSVPLCTPCEVPPHPTRKRSYAQVSRIRFVQSGPLLYPTESDYMVIFYKLFGK